MLGEYKVGRCTQQCYTLQRPLRSGEWYYSVVVEEGDDLQRREYSAEAWSDPPENAVGWWKSRMPTSEEKKMVLAPPEVLVDLLRQMESIPERQKSRYLLALMLMRRRVLKAANPPQETRDQLDYMRVLIASTGEEMGILIPRITREEVDLLRDELNELLYCEAEEEMDEQVMSSQDSESNPSLVGGDQE